MRMRIRMAMTIIIKKKILINIIMSYYLFNRQEILQKSKKKYSKEKAPEYYLQNKEVRSKHLS